MGPSRDDTERLAECATMLVAIARILLDTSPTDFAAWLRRVADEIDSKGFDHGLGLTMAANDEDVRT